jgi:thioredoxin reductase (NADPH)
MSGTLPLVLYALVATLLIGVYALRRRASDAAHRRVLDQSRTEGLTEPASLHPVVDPTRCIGSGGCEHACPEGALGVVGGKAVLTNPTLCIGHGACADSCPVAAITLVFGSERRGVDIPQVDPKFETNVPGVFIVGELGGMGLIRKAAMQGRQAVSTIAGRKRGVAPYDVVIVGAGPAGIAAGLGAVEAKLRYVLLEQEPDLGGSVFHFPRNKVAMTAPVDLPLVGRMKFTEVSKEALLEFWKRIISQTGVAIRFGERMEKLERGPNGHRVVTGSGVYEATAVVLAIGRRGTPRTLDVPGEALPKVVYRLIDAEQYRRQRVLVVGGGDSAVEAALACAAEPDTEVTLAYRGDAFNRLKPANRDRLAQAGPQHRLRVLTKTNVVRIHVDRVELDIDGRVESIANDAVIVQAGGVLPADVLRRAGIGFETKFGTA